MDYVDSGQDEVVLNAAEEEEDRLPDGRMQDLHVTIKRDEKGRFIKGTKKSERSGVKKADPDTMRILKAGCPDAARLLIDMMCDGRQPAKLRVHCAEVVLERVLGKPRQAVDLTTEGMPQVVFVGYDRIAD